MVGVSGVREKEFLRGVVNSGTNYITRRIGWTKGFPLAMSTVKKTIVTMIAAAIGLPPNINQWDWGWG